jgi:hypothetical protein
MAASKFFRLIPIRSNQAKEKETIHPKLKEKSDLSSSSSLVFFFHPFTFSPLPFAFVAFCIVVSEFSSFFIASLFG